ncbi:MAG: class I SAM-dependent methyltransferase [bacterium]
MGKLTLVEQAVGATPDWRGIRTQILRVLTGKAQLYARARFRVIPARFLDDIIQYLPERGTVIDLGCGFGLFTLAFALARPNCNFIGLDMDEKRIAVAQSIIEKLKLTNISFLARDVCEVRDELGKDIDTLIMLDLIHHIPVAPGDRVLEHALALVKPGGYFLVKDVGTQPRWMAYFTYLMDKLTSDGVVYYRSINNWRETLTRIGVKNLHIHHQRDSIPYPHILCVGNKDR